MYVYYSTNHSYSYKKFLAYQFLIDHGLEDGRDGHQLGVGAGAVVAGVAPPEAEGLQLELRLRHADLVPRGVVSECVEGGILLYRVLDKGCRTKGVENYPFVTCILI